jgi:hypothetical protein
MPCCFAFVGFLVVAFVLRLIARIDQLERDRIQHANWIYDLQHRNRRLSDHVAGRTSDPDFGIDGPHNNVD